MGSSESRGSFLLKQWYHIGLVAAKLLVVGGLGYSPVPFIPTPLYHRHQQHSHLCTPHPNNNHLLPGPRNLHPTPHPSHPNCSTHSFNPRRKRILDNQATTPRRHHINPLQRHSKRQPQIPKPLINSNLPLNPQNLQIITRLLRLQNQAVHTTLRRTFTSGREFCRTSRRHRCL